MQFKNPTSTKNMTTLHLGKSIGRSPLRYGLFLTALVLACFALSPQARAVCQDGCLTNENTVLGDDALLSNTTGFGNTATGFQALLSNTAGGDNTANGVDALFSNTTGGGNTAVGAEALSSNTAGIQNTALGDLALDSNTTGGLNTACGLGAVSLNTTRSNNVACGDSAMQFNTTGSFNTAVGTFALSNNSRGNENTATGFEALGGNTTGIHNTADGFQALESNDTGNFNIASGQGALSNNTSGSNNAALGQNALVSNTTGSSNVAIGSHAGFNLTTGSNNIDIGNPGIATEAGIIRIGTVGTQTATFIAGVSVSAIAGGAVVVNNKGRLGVASSSQRFKDQIKPMEKTSEAVLALRPVTFRYKPEIDPERAPQFGLVAEEVEKINPALVTRDAQGKVFTVRYEAVNAMLLNEFLKEHRTVQELKSVVAKQEATIAQQQKGMKGLTATLKEQAAQIQKVNDKVEMSRPAPQVVDSNH